MNTIRVEVKEVYGNTLIYPVCRRAQLFADLTGKKTLTPQAVRLIKALGYEIETVTKSIEVGV